MDFFEVWEKKARAKGDLSIGCDIGIHAAKQALKGIMVGEPMTYRFYQNVGSMFFASERGDFELYHSFHIDPRIPDGEEVVVMVFKKP